SSLEDALKRAHFRPSQPAGLSQRSGPVRQWEAPVPAQLIRLRQPESYERELGPDAHAAAMAARPLELTMALRRRCDSQTCDRPNTGRALSQGFDSPKSTLIGSRLAFSSC